MVPGPGETALSQSNIQAFGEVSNLACGILHDKACSSGARMLLGANNDLPAS